MPSDNAIPSFAAADLRRWTASVFAAAGARAEDAQATADVLVRTSLRGIDTHGVARILIYLEKVLSGEVNAEPNPVSELREGVLFFDGDGGLGQSMAMQAMREAAALARETSIVTCILRRTGHLAALGQFVLEAAEQGMVALLCQETPPLMGLVGSTRQAIGNNPIAFAAPVAGKAPLVFDIAASVVARGNFTQALRDNQPIPEGWAIGPDGEPTTDAATALKGCALPIAGHKGIGLAMIVQVLAGSLSASAASTNPGQHSTLGSAANVSAFLLMINPDRIIGRAAFDAHMAAWLANYSASSAQGARYPGERAAESEKIRNFSGIPVPLSVVAELLRAGELVGRPFDLAPLRG
jgi:LDH2 family malate/lactate/ureidoglycolate dehydrogenase